MPWLDYLFFKNPILRRVKNEKASPVVTFAMARANERLEELEKDKAKTMNDRDFLSGFINAMSKDPSIPKSYVFNPSEFTLYLKSLSLTHILPFVERSLHGQLLT